MSRFYFGSDSDSDNDSLHLLPFPAPLSRDAFSANIDAPFSPTAFLGTLRHRHQTLEDLRAELQLRSKDLETELMELVNSDYVDFVGLGSSLNGGERKVEDLKMGLWSFRRDVEGVAGRIEEVVKEVEAELKFKDGIKKEKVCFLCSCHIDIHPISYNERRREECDIPVLTARPSVVLKMIARILLVLSQRVDELSSLLLLDGSTPPGSASLLFSSGSGTEGGEALTSIARLNRIVSGYRYVMQNLVPNIPEEHPFLKVQLYRVEMVRSTCLLDLGTTLKESKLGGDVDKTIAVMGFYADLGGVREAVKVLKGLKQRK